MAEGMKIDDATPDVEVSGGELIPVSDGGSAKSVTTARLRDFVIGAIKNKSETESLSEHDFVLVSDGTDVKRFTAERLADLVIAQAFAKEEAASIGDNDTISVESSGSAKTIKVADLVEYVREEIEPPSMDIASLDEAEEISAEDYAAVSQASEEAGVVTNTPKKCRLAAFAEWILGRIPFFVRSGTRLESEDEIIYLRNSDSKVCVIRRSDAGFGNGDVVGPSLSTTQGKIPQWDSENHKLTDGLNLTQNVGESSQSTEVPSASAVFSALADAGDLKVSAPPSNTNNKIPQWDGDGTKKLKDGLEITTTIGLGSTNSQIPTALAVERAIYTSVAAKARHLGTYTRWVDLPISGYYEGEICTVQINSSLYLTVFFTSEGTNLRWWYIGEGGVLQLGGATE